MTESPRRFVRSMRDTAADLVGGRLLALLFGVLVLGTAGLAEAATYQACIKWSIDTVDSNFEIAGGPNDGGHEDQYLGCNAGCDVIARGARIKLARAGFSTTLDTSPSTGCATWTDSGGSGVYDLTVYGYATDANGTRVRIHTPTSEACNEPGGPGQTYSALIQDASFTPGASNTYTVNYASKWTAMASAAFTLYRIGHIANKEINIELASACEISTAHYGDSNSFITDGIHCLQLGDSCTPPSTPRTRAKFIVAHEMGHAIAALYYGGFTGAVNGWEPNTTNSNASPSSPDRCGPGGDLYTIGSKEYNSIAFRESWGHIVSARVWNDKSDEGAFGWASPATDLERYGPTGSHPSACQTNGSNCNNSGGRLENYCCVSGTDGSCTSSWSTQGTIEDWMRFLWDFYTTPNNYCPGGAQASFQNLLDIYAQTRLQGGLTSTNYAVKMRAAAELVLGSSSCLLQAYDDLRVHNGADH